MSLLADPALDGLLMWVSGAGSGAECVNLAARNCEGGYGAEFYRSKTGRIKGVVVYRFQDDVLTDVHIIGKVPKSVRKELA